MKTRAIAAALTLSLSGLAFISAREGRSLTAYRDPIGVVTICDGHIKTAKMGQTVTNEVCDSLLRADVKESEAAVKRLVTIELTQEQYLALVDFTFNLGQSNLASSTLLRKANAGDCMGAGKEFSRWNRAAGQVLKGLTVRRELERKLWESGCSP